jgi:predicted glycoside hydrolase/deacetylase ChbG (UPF0249 family)
VIKEFSVTPKPQNKNAKILMCAFFVLALISVVITIFIDKYKGVVGMVTLASLTTAILVYVKYVAVTFHYDIVAEGVDEPLFVVRQTVGKRNATLCRVAFADIVKVEKEIRAQIERFKSFGVTPSHIDNHMGSLYGIETGRFELLNLTLAIAGEYGLPFRFPGTFVPQMFANDTLAVKIDLDMIKMFYDKVLEFAKANGVAMPDFLIPGEWNGPQNDSYENFKEYIYELYRSFPNGITETYIHPAFESEELKGISGAWHRRVWEHKLFSDPQTLQHIKACGIQLINYRDLAEMKK